MGSVRLSSSVLRAHTSSMGSDILTLAIPATISAGIATLSAIAWVFSKFQKSEKTHTIEFKAAAAASLAAQKSAAAAALAEQKSVAAVALAAQKSVAALALAAQKSEAQKQRDELLLSQKLQLVEAATKKEAARLTALAAMQVSKIDSDTARDRATNATNLAVNQIKLEASKRLAEAKEFDAKMRYEAALAASAARRK